jgi:uncharacterized repeat protein (TIGR04076 family)
MPFDVPKCKITVLKRTIDRELAAEYLDVSLDEYGPCTRFTDGQEIIVTHPYQMPEEFCPWAWADIRQDIMTIATGGDLPWIKQRGATISGCTDWFRPVIFKIERVVE